MRLVAALLAAALCYAAQPQKWVTEGFDGFRRGAFDAGGANLYVSRGGALQTINRLDVNNDGIPDLIFNNTHDLVYVLPSTVYDFVKGRNLPTVQEHVGPGAVRVLARDLNGDGVSDLVIARGFDNMSRWQNSSVYWGGPKGWTDSMHIELPTPYVQDVCVVDLNHDGRPDLAFISSGPAGYNRSQIFFGQAEGYTIHRRLEIDTPGATSCAGADLDRDGFDDLIVTAPGDGGFILWDTKTRSPLPLKGTLAAAAIAGRLALSTKEGVSVFDAHGRSFAEQQAITLPGAGRLTIASLTPGGAPDLIVTHASDGREWSSKSSVFPAFDVKKRFDLPTVGATDAAVGDLDRDGWPDIAFANYRSNLDFDISSFVYWGAPDGFSEQRRSSVPTHGAVGVAIADGKLAFANSIKGRPIGDIDTYVYFGGPNSAYSSKNMQRLPTIGGYESCVADLNDDGFADAILVGSHEGDTGGLAGSYIYWGTAKGITTKGRTELPTSGAIGCAVGDVNHDGYLDAVFANIDQEGVQIFFGGKDGFTAARQQKLAVSAPRFPLIADVDRDGFPDLLVPSIKEGMLIFRGSARGFEQTPSIRLDATVPVSEQVADLNRDGWPDLIVCNLMDETRGLYHGVNTYIYWGSPQGFSALRRTELPSLGAHHAVVADFNRDGSLDIFISNYQSEMTRSLDSYIYWGNAAGEYSASRRTALHNESAAGVIAADLNGDGWVDLAVSNHNDHGDHHTKSLIFWNAKGVFNETRVTSLPTIGPHMMTGVDSGNMNTRAMDEVWTSRPWDAGVPSTPLSLEYAGSTQFGSHLRFEIRSAASEKELDTAKWAPVTMVDNAKQGHAPAARAGRWWQYRIHLLGSAAAWPMVRKVEIDFVPGR